MKAEILDKHYRKIEELLNDFKNKKIGYSEFIDNIFILEKEYADWKIKECLPEIENKVGIQRIDDMIEGKIMYRDQILSNKDKI